jgi:SAM-dependent methyltransferase
VNAPDTRSRKERESDYWQGIADGVFKDGNLAANIHKAEQTVSRILAKVSMIHQNVLEIGVGGALVAGVLNMLVLGNWRYTGTDMAPKFVERAKSNFHLKVVQTDVTALPGEDGQYTRVICLDSLEHVHPDDRERGYAEIARVTKQGGVLLINMPLWEGFHDQEFDHPFGPQDFTMLKKAGFDLISYEAYMVPTPEKARPSAFVVLERV